MTFKLLGLLLLSTRLLASDFNVKGFIALDLINVEKIDGSKESAEVGYGTADVKFYFNHDDFSTKVKLDIDGGSDPYDLLEEALVMYRPSENFKFTFGKGKIRFHQMHYGITDVTYTDGGYMLNTKHSFRDQDRKLLANVEIGKRDALLTHNITFFGNNQEANRDKSDPSLPYLKNGNDSIAYSSQKAFNTKTQRGAVYQLQVAPNRDTTITTSALYFWRDIDPDADWAFNIAFNKDTATYEVWFESIFAYSSKHPNDKYTQRKQYDHLSQLGFLYKFTEVFAAGVNLENAIVRQTHHNSSDYPSTYGQSTYNDGQTSKFVSYKADFGIQFKPGRKVQVSSGFVIERQERLDSPYSTDKKPSQQLGVKNAYSVNAGLSFWF